EAMEDYRLASKRGDIVRLPNGVLGIISDCDIVMGGQVKMVSVFPFAGWLYRLWLMFRNKLNYYDYQINDLEFIK
ncbi:hypothetical protein ACFLZ9_01045, partial [Patescibacteria group bacterium]